VKLPDEVPVMTLPHATLFPQAMLPLYIFEPRYRRMLEDALASHRMFSVAMQKPTCKRETPCRVAGLGLIRASVQNKNGTSHLILQGLTRVRLDETVRHRPYRVARIQALQPKATESVAVDALTAKVRELVKHRVESITANPGSAAGEPLHSLPSWQQFAEHLARLNDPEQVADMTACTLLRDSRQRQELLEAVDIETRLRRLVRFLLDDSPAPTALT
jgi:Lon protease-like protein